MEEGFEVEWLRLDTGGRLDLEHASALLREDTVLVSQMLVNNEVGAVQPVAELAGRLGAAAPHAWLHVDAVQAFGKLDVRLVGLGAHALSLSAHKLHGPKGAGALVLARGVSPRPLVHGGGQEAGLRSGTEAVAACVGFGRAIELATEARAGSQERAAAPQAGTCVRNVCACGCGCVRGPAAGVRRVAVGLVVALAAVVVALFTIWLLLLSLVLSPRPCCGAVPQGSRELPRSSGAGT